jgi:hypothetical protein
MTYDVMEISGLARLRKALLDYCRQDTLGLVRLLEKIRGIP